jgi:hypothetical protein
MTIEIFGANFCLFVVAIAMVSAVIVEIIKPRVNAHPVVLHWVIAYVLYMAVAMVAMLFGVVLFDFWRLVQVVVVCAFINVGYKGGTSFYDFLANFISALPRRKRSVERRFDAK